MTQTAPTTDSQAAESRVSMVIAIMYGNRILG